MRPDLVSSPNSPPPVSLNPPGTFFKSMSIVLLLSLSDYLSPRLLSFLFLFILFCVAIELPGVGELMLASFPTDAKSDIPIRSNWYVPSPSLICSHLLLLSHIFQLLSHVPLFIILYLQVDGREV